MAICGKIQKKKKEYCIGDLDKRVILQSRSTNSNSFDLSETFTDIATVWARIETNNKATEFFDGVNLNKAYSHIIVIRYRNDLNGIDTWIEYNDERYNVIDIENINEESDWLLLKCNKKGAKTIEANDA